MARTALTHPRPLQQHHNEPRLRLACSQRPSAKWRQPRFDSAGIFSLIRAGSTLCARLRGADRPDRPDRPAAGGAEPARSHADLTRAAVARRLCRLLAPAAGLQHRLARWQHRPGDRPARHQRTNFCL